MVWSTPPEYPSMNPPQYAACWGAELHGGVGCLPNFVPGKLHFKNNFCDNCRDLIVVPLVILGPERHRFRGMMDRPN